MKNVILLFVFILCGCSKTDPGEAILGKWELVAEGEKKDKMETIEPNGAYMEFLSDGVYRLYYPIEDEYYCSSYKIDRKFLYYNYEKTYEQGRFDHTYRFTENQLITTYVYGNRQDIMGLPNIFIYQRKK